MNTDDNKDPKDPKETSDKESRGIARRDIIQGLAGIPVLGLFGYALHKQTGYDKAQRAARTPPPTRTDLPDVNVALLGAGDQGQVLMHAMLKIPNIKIRAVCDIWTEYTLRRVVNTLNRFDHEVNGYEDYREMLDKEQGLDAVIIATPDFWHAQHTIDSLKAGLHVYCEKEMSNTIEGARSMVAAARESGKLLQIGHQRRSHPRYVHCYEKLIKEANLLGRIVTVNGQWNRTVQPDLGYPQRYAIPDDRLRQYGFRSMEQFRNWRWYRGLGGGPIVDLGSHQIDIYNWFLEANPRSVMASGGLDYYSPDTREWYDTVMAVFEYETPQGTTRAYYQTQTTNGSQGYFENFMGDQGTLVISESEASYPGLVYREVTAPAWDEWVQRGYVTRPKVVVAQPEVEAMLDVRESISPDEHRLPIEFHDAYHKPHLENFVYAILGLEELNCPAEIGYESAVTVLKVNEAIESGRRIEYKPEEFHI
jgi:predicted dehydrogenase